MSVATIFPADEESFASTGTVGLFSILKPSLHSQPLSDVKTLTLTPMRKGRNAATFIRVV
jgi:hypothetical protein